MVAAGIKDVNQMLAAGGRRIGNISVDLQVYLNPISWSLSSYLI